MAVCELSGKKPVSKNLVSHSNIKTKSISQPNIQNKRLFSQAMGQFVAFKVATSTIRTMEHIGGFDKYILRQPTEVLSQKARSFQKRLKKKLKISTKKEI